MSVAAEQVCERGAWMFEAEGRQNKLRELLASRPLVRVIEAHNGLSALVAYNACFDERRYDALWHSSFTDSAMRAKADIEIVDTAARLMTINEIFDAVPLPLIYDGDTGGSPERIFHLTRALARIGVSALCIEDKEGAKRNSLLGTSVIQNQTDVALFCDKIAASRGAMNASQMMFVARIESFVLGAGLKDALRRADAYVAAGADAILIHSIAPTPREVAEFAGTFRRSNATTPIFAVPTTYGGAGERELADAGINCVIYANHLLRAAFPAMAKVAEHILRESRAEDDYLRAALVPPRQLIDLLPPEV